MSAQLGANQYGKAESRLVRVIRDTDRHEIRDLNVTTTLRGDFAAAHLTGDQSGVLPTDTQKNTVYAFAKEKGVSSIEEFGRALAEHFVRSVETVQWARVSIEEYGWERILTEDGPHDHSFVRQGQEVRTTSVTAELRDRELAVSVVSGLKDLTILKSTGSEFRGFHVDKYTTLAETDDRILATSLVARWRYADLDVDFDDCYARARRVMLSRFATVHSRALQESLYQMGIAALDEVPQLAEVRFSAPNKHHFLVDLDRFGVANDGEVFFAADRPYGLIEAAVVREGSTGQWPVESFC